MKSQRRSLGILFALGLAASLIVGCNLFSSLFGGGGTGTLHLMVTDKPFPFTFVSSAIVTITKIEVHATSQPCDDEGDDNEDENDNNHEDDNGATTQPCTSEPSDDNDEGEGGGFITIFEGEKSFDLLNLRNGKTDLLADANIPAGNYDQMRLIVTGGEVTLTDGRVFPLKVPSGEETGIKLHFDFEVQANTQTTLLLDVDLSRAFSAIPSGHIDDVSTIRSFQFHPSIAMRLINVLEAGSITGHVTDSSNGNVIANAAVTAFDGTEEVTTTSTEADGSYVLGGLHTATYRVHFAADGFAETDVDNINIQAGQLTANVDAALTASP